MSKVETIKSALKFLVQKQIEQGSHGFSDADDNEISWDEVIRWLEQQPKTGHWLDKKTTIKGGHGLAYGRYGCSVCKKKQPSKTDFCPSCGADMREVQDDGI